MNDLKIYQYWIDKQWETEHSLAIVARSKKEADAIYESYLDEDGLDWGEIESKEHEIKLNTIIAPYGYDQVDLLIEERS